MRTKKKTSKLRYFTQLLLCAAALISGGVFSVWRAQNKRAPLPVPTHTKQTKRSPERGASTTMPIPGPRQSTDMERQPLAVSPADSAPYIRPPSFRGPQAAPSEKEKIIDFSAYKPKPRGSQGENFLPRDRSLPAGQLQGHIAPRTTSDDPGKGFFGDVMREGRKILKSVDDATLEASRHALRPIARPEEATIRPYEDGARLNIVIPADTVNLKRKK